MDYSQHIAALHHALTHAELSPTERAEVQQHLERLIEAQEAELALKRMERWTADRGGQLVLQDQGYRVILGHAGASADDHHPSPPGRFNQVGIGGPDVEPVSHRVPPHTDNEIVFQEAKAGEDYRLEAYGQSEQGSFAYLQDIIVSGRDPRLASAFAELKASHQCPGFLQALRHGAVRIRYQFVNVLPSGSVRTGLFKVDDRSRLRWNGEGVELLI